MCSDKYKDEDNVLGMLPEATSVLRTTYLMPSMTARPRSTLNLNYCLLWSYSEYVQMIFDLSARRSKARQRGRGKTHPHTVEEKIGGSL